MKPIDQLQGHPLVETIVDTLCARNLNPDREFFTVHTCYYLSRIASMMRVNVDAKGLGKFFVNFYAINVAPSGFGKGVANSMLQDQVINRFMDVFLGDTQPTIANSALLDLAHKRCISKGTSEEEELEAVNTEYRKLGAYLPYFDSGTTPALKQFRHKLLMDGIGSINLEVDEVGNNLLDIKDVLATYLELYDGITKPKLIKNTAESIRNEEIIGKTPANMLLFGTPSMLLDGALTEKAFFDLLVTGYARRCFFGFSDKESDPRKLTIDQRMELLTNGHSDRELFNISSKLAKLADPINHKFTVHVPDSIIRSVLEYQDYCADQVDTFRSTDEIRKSEAKGRFFKTLKLAGVFAFVDGCPEMQESHWEAAVKVAEYSAVSFSHILSREPAHGRLAIYLSECREPATLAELMEELPFFPKTGSAQKDMIKHAIAWGYKNNLVIKRSYVDDIEFIHGEALEKTDLDRLRLSWVSTAFEGASEGFYPETEVPFDRLDQVVQMENGHWCTHHFVDGRRKKTHAIKGFNIIVLDIDGTLPLSSARVFFKDYTYMIHTTRHHQISKDGATPADRYRIILPTSHLLKFTPEEYCEFMDNIFESLPMIADSDTASKEINRKWLANPNAIVETNEGVLFDVLPYIPKTKKNEERLNTIANNSSLDPLERYFLLNAKEGNRNNVLYKYGAALLDAGYNWSSIDEKINTFNKKLSKPITSKELESTVLNSLKHKFAQRG